MLCGGCHDRVHAGTLVIRGSAPDGLTFLHGDGRPLGAPPPEVVASQPSVFADAVSALVNLQFSKSAARAAVEAVRAHVDAAPTVEEVVRAALRQLRQR